MDQEGFGWIPGWVYVVPTSNNWKLAYGAGIFSSGLKMDFFNRIGRKQRFALLPERRRWEIEWIGEGQLSGIYP